MADDEQGDGVLANLPSTRPSRLSRRGARASESAPAAPEPKAPAKPRSKPKPKAKAAAKPAAPKAAKPQPVPDAPKPRAVRPATPKLKEPVEKAAEQREPDSHRPSGTELVSTVVQAAGELAQVGVTVGGQILKRAIDRLPKK
jgi:outer membrane biosynthesis protein TonB